MDDLAARLSNRIQLTTDGLNVYMEAVEGAFGADIDYAMLIKLYGASQEEVRYSPSECDVVENRGGQSFCEPQFSPRLRLQKE